MKLTSLRNTQLRVSRLCMGTLNFGVALDQDQVRRHLDRFVEAGGNFIDTAHVYSDWLEGPRSRAEKALGKWLRTVDRGRVVVATKCAHFDFARPEVSRVTPEDICRDLDESLDFLQTDYVDLLLLHRDNPDVPADELVDCLDELVRSGKARYVGCSNWTMDRVEEALACAERSGKAPFVVNQLMWSLARVNRSGIPSDYVVMDDAMLARHEKLGLNVMCFSSQAKGYFARRYAGERFGDDITSVYGNPENDAIYERLLANLGEGTMTQQSLRYFENQPVTAIPIVSCDTMEQLEECMSAFEPAQK